jgi:hypothetical protein
MTDNLATVKYVMDTNTLIGFSIWIPVKLNKTFWDKLASSLQEGKWVLLSAVVKEIKYNEPLEEWCKKQKRKNLASELGEDDKNKAIEINNEYPMIDQATYKSTVDTYIIAYAFNHQMGVFSREIRKTDKEKLYKIPDVCRKLNVKYIKKPEDFLESIGF